MNHKQEVSLRFSKTHLVHDIRILFKVFSDLFFFLILLINYTSSSVNRMMSTIFKKVGEIYDIHILVDFCST